MMHLQVALYDVLRSGVVCVGAARTALEGGVPTALGVVEGTPRGTPERLLMGDTCGCGFDHVLTSAC